MLLDPPNYFLFYAPIRLKLVLVVAPKVSQSPRTHIVDLLKSVRLQFFRVAVALLVRKAVEVLLLWLEGRPREIQQHGHKQHYQQRRELPEQDLSVDLLKLLVVPALLVLLLLPAPHVVWVLSWQVLSKKEVTEQVVWCDEVPAEVLIVASRVAASPSGLPLLVGFLAAHLVVDSALVRITEAGHGRVDFLECVSGFRVRVFIWMHLHRPLLVCFFELALCAIPLYTENLVVVLAFDDVFAVLLVLGCVGSLVLGTLITVYLLPRGCCLCRGLGSGWLGCLLLFFGVLSSEEVKSLKQDLCVCGLVHLD